MWNVPCGCHMASKARLRRGHAWPRALVLQQRHDVGSEWESKGWSRVKESSWRKVVMEGSETGERAPLQIRAERMDQQQARVVLGERRLGAVLHGGSLS
jgi:hypothetical protein